MSYHMSYTILNAVLVMVVLDGYFADIRRVACFCCVIIFLIESFDKIEVFSDKYFC